MIEKIYKRADELIDKVIADNWPLSIEVPTWGDVVLSLSRVFFAILLLILSSGSLLLVCSTYSFFLFHAPKNKFTNWLTIICVSRCSHHVVTKCVGFVLDNYQGTRSNSMSQKFSDRLPLIKSAAHCIRVGLRLALLDCCGTGQHQSVVPGWCFHSGIDIEAVPELFLRTTLALLLERERVAIYSRLSHDVILQAYSLAVEEISEEAVIAADKDRGRLWRMMQAKANFAAVVVMVVEELSGVCEARRKKNEIKYDFMGIMARYENCSKVFLDAGMEVSNNENALLADAANDDVAFWVMSYVFDNEKSEAV